MVRRAVLGLVAIVAMAMPANAWGGGFASVGLHELPTNVRAGTPWAAEFTVLGHGRTPVPGLRPIVTIVRADGPGERTFAATQTGQPGVYRANVVFPAHGSWKIVISEWKGSPGHSFGTVSHTFGTVAVDGRGQAGSGGKATRTKLATPDRDGPWAALLAALAAGVLAGVAAAMLQRRRAPGPA